MALSTTDSPAHNYGVTQHSFWFHEIANLAKTMGVLTYNSTGKNYGNQKIPSLWERFIPFQLKVEMYPVHELKLGVIRLCLHDLVASSLRTREHTGPEFVFF